MHPRRALADWTRTRLVVPAGHPNAGKPLELAPFAVDFLEDALEPGIRESLLTCGRKNGKSAILAALILAHYADDGPLRRPGFRIAVASISREKSAELWLQCFEIAEAADLAGLTFGKVPRMVQSDFGRADFLSADRKAGHSTAQTSRSAMNSGCIQIQTAAIWSRACCRQPRHATAA